jgi:hypothetical protein
MSRGRVGKRERTILTTRTNPPSAAKGDELPRRPRAARGPAVLLLASPAAGRLPRTPMPEIRPPLGPEFPGVGAP